MEKVKDLLTKMRLFKFIKILLKKPYYSFRGIGFKKYSSITLKNFVDVLNKFDIKYIAVYGTLLGIVRENKILDHDLDIDIGIFREDIEKFLNVEGELLKKGFKIISEVRLLNSNELIEKSYLSEQKVKIDIYIINKIEDNYKIKFWLMPDNMSLGEYQKKSGYIDIYEQVFALFEVTEKNIKHDIKIKIPIKSEKILEDMYGQNWKVPDKNWNGNKFYENLKIQEKGRVIR